MILSALAVLMLAAAPAAPAPAAVPSPLQQAWERLLSLEGTWTGTAGQKGGEQAPTTVTYRVTGNRSVVMETLFAGTPHEMITMYHLDGQDLVLTHYCAARNQPRMKAKTLTRDLVEFDFVSATNLLPGAMHMHSARLEFPGPDKLRAEWTSWAEGKPGHVAVFDLTRAKR